MSGNLRNINRREFVSGSLAAATSLAIANSSNADDKKKKYKICAFEKFIQALNYDELGETIADLGFDGIEATVRNGGHIEPEKVEDELPKMVAALKKHNVEITVMASDINRVDTLSERVLKTAAGLGVKRYRTKYYRYDLKKPVLGQLDEFRPMLKDLVELNRDLGMSAVYQNHSGAHVVGALVWDLHSLIKDYSVKDIGIAFDIRHATVEGGLAWPVHFNLMQPHLGAVYIKDFKWSGRKPQNVPLGEGQVDPKFFEILTSSQYKGPISLHVEYLPKAGTEKNIDALRNDLKTLKRLLA